MAKNLRNVAIPGSGIPLSLFCLLKGLTFLFVMAINPIVCFLAAINAQRKHERCGVAPVTRIHQCVKQDHDRVACSLQRLANVGLQKASDFGFFVSSLYDLINVSTM